MLTYIGIGFAVSFIVPFPASLCVLLFAFILLNIYRADLALRKQGSGGIKGLYRSMSSSFASGGSGMGAAGEDTGQKSIKFYCMNCGNEHRNDTCPKCGSKAVMVG